MSFGGRIQTSIVSSVESSNRVATERLVARAMIQNGSYIMSQKGSSTILSIGIEQLRGARALLGWSQTQLAERAGLSLPTVKRVEAERGPRVSESARYALQRALELGGIEFIDENGGGPGVRLRKRRQLKKAK